MVSPEVHIHSNSTVNPDSIEIGTPSKGGTIKVYLDFGNIEKCKQKIDNALEVRKYINAKIEVKV